MNDERKFLHDIASPLGTAILLIGMLEEDLGKKAALGENELAKVGQIALALEKIHQLLRARREILIERGVPGSS